MEILLIALPLFIFVIDFLGFLIKGRRVFDTVLIRIMEIEANQVSKQYYFEMGAVNGGPAQSR